MHLGNGAITPECGIYALGAAATSTAIALIVARSKPLDRNAKFTAAALGAAVFAAQMFNVQIMPFSSAHLIGGVLLAWVLGPSLGLLMMTAVLTIEALILGDGGLLALGINVINMGVAPAVFVAVARRFTCGSGAWRESFVLAAVSLLASSAAFAQSTTAEGAANGARAGGDIGGPIGAMVGGTVGAAVGAGLEISNAVLGAVPRSEPSVVVRERVVVGEPLPPTVELRPVPYRYAVVNDRRVIVEPRTRKVIKIID